MSVDGATDTSLFRHYVKQVLVPTPVAGDMVVIDRLGAHNASGIREAIEAASANSCRFRFKHSCRQQHL